MQAAIHRDWKKNKSIKTHLFYTLCWNIFSWSAVFKIDGHYQVNGTKCHSIFEAISREPLNLAVFLFPLLGLLMMYSCVAHWKNKTEFKLEDGNFKTVKGPLPWFGKTFSIPVTDIKQAYVQEYVTISDNDRLTRYRVLAQLNSGDEVVVDADICDYDDARQLEMWLENKLGIVDTCIPGEVEIKKVA